VPPPPAETVLPAEYLRKHLAGLGVTPKRVEGREITQILLLPVQHLSEFYESKNAENKLGASVNKGYNQFTSQEDVIIGDIVRKTSSGDCTRAYLRAGPRKTLYFCPTEVRAAIVTCGGLCPGLNNIIREVSKSLLNLYGVSEVWGVRGGYWGFHESSENDKNLKPIRLTHDVVSGIQHKGGTILGSARGGYDLEQMFGFCARYNITQLYVVGGDGTHRAANKFGLEAIERKANIAVAGIPKTIDNDLDLVDRTFGFNSAVMAAQAAIKSAATEARDNLPNGIGIVKLMGRHAGFIAAHATLASGDVDLCLVPEVKVELEGTYGVLPHIERVCSRQRANALS
jgi:6-phosphofructokinase 1